MMEAAATAAGENDRRKALRFSALQFRWERGASAPQRRE
jgi:hypothetical protein